LDTGLIYGSICLEVEIISLICFPLTLHTQCSLSFIRTHKFLPGFLSNAITVAGEIFALKSIAAYRSGLEINTNVTKKDAEEGLEQVLIGE